MHDSWYHRIEIFSGFSLWYSHSVSGIAIAFWFSILQSMDLLELQAWKICSSLSWSDSGSYGAVCLCCCELFLRVSSVWQQFCCRWWLLKLCELGFLVLVAHLGLPWCCVCSGCRLRWFLVNGLGCWGALAFASQRYWLWVHGRAGAAPSLLEHSHGFCHVYLRGCCLSADSLSVRRPTMNPIGQSWNDSFDVGDLAIPDLTGGYHDQSDPRPSLQNSVLQIASFESAASLAPSRASATSCPDATTLNRFVRRLYLSSRKHRMA